MYQGFLRTVPPFIATTLRYATIELRAWHAQYLCITLIWLGSLGNLRIYVYPLCAVFRKFHWSTPDGYKESSCSQLLILIPKFPENMNMYDTFTVHHEQYKLTAHLADTHNVTKIRQRILSNSIPFHLPQISHHSLINLLAFGLRRKHGSSNPLDKQRLSHKCLDIIIGQRNLWILRFQLEWQYPQEYLAICELHFTTPLCLFLDYIFMNWWPDLRRKHSSSRP